MKLKKKAKRVVIVLLLIILVLLGVLFIKDKFSNTKEVEENKVVNKIEKYDYTLKDNKTKEYRKMFDELKKILSEKEVDEEEYVKKISEMFIYDFYSLDDKTAKTDIGGVDFVYSDILENFLQNAQNTYYKYVESNIYNNRNQNLPTVKEIEIESVKQEAFAYGDETDDKTYIVDATWTYTDTEFSDYQNNAQLIFIHDGDKLWLVELQ